MAANLIVSSDAHGSSSDGALEYTVRWVLTAAMSVMAMGTVITHLAQIFGISFQFYAVIVAGTNRQLANDQEVAKETHGITALNIRDGKPFWRHSLRSGPVRWGVAIDREGRVLVSLRSGQVICFGPEG